MKLNFRKGVIIILNIFSEFFLEAFILYNQVTSTSNVVILEAASEILQFTVSMTKKATHLM